MPKKTNKKSSSSKKVSSSSKKTSELKVKVKSASEQYNRDSVYCQFMVTNYKKTIQFYSEVLEWKPSRFSEDSPDPDQIGWFEFELPLKGAFLGLNKSEDGKFTPSTSLVISVKYLEEFKATLNSKKANPSDITDVPNMISFLTVKDPDDNQIMFISEPRVKT